MQAQARHRSVTPQSPRSKGRYDHVQPKVDSGRRRSKTPPPRRVAPAAATSPASARSAPTGGYAASRGGCGSGYPRNRPRDPQRPLPVTAAAATTPASEPAAEPVAAPSQQPPSASYFTASACDSYTALGGYDAGFGTASPQLPEAPPLPQPLPQPFLPHESDTQACARETFERDVFGGALRRICDESLVTDASFAAPSTLNLRPSRRRSRRRDGGGARSPRGRRTRDASVGDTDEDAAVARVYAETLSRVEDMERGLDLQLIGAGGGGGSGGGAGGHSNLLALDVHLLQQEMRQADARAAALRQALHEQAVLKEREAEELRRLSESLHDEERSPSGAGGGRGRLRHHGSVAAPPLPSYVLSDDAPVFDATAGASVPEWREGIGGGSGGGAALKGRARVEGGDDVGGGGGGGVRAGHQTAERYPSFWY